MRAEQFPINLIFMLVTALLLLIVAAPAAATDLMYWETLATQPVATWSDALRGLSATLRSDGVVPEFAAVEAQFAASPLLARVVRRPPAAPLRRGTLALLTVRTLQLDGGFWLYCFPNSERYALRAAAWHGVMQGEGAAEYVSGAELLAVLTRIRERMQAAAATAAAAAPPPTPVAPAPDPTLPRVQYTLPGGS